MKPLALLALLLPTLAYAARPPAQVAVAADESTVVTVQAVPTSQPTTAPAATAQVTIEPSPWAKVRDALIGAIVAIIGAGTPVLIVWIRSLATRIAATDAKATTAAEAGQAAHSVAVEAMATGRQALAAAPSVIPGGKRATDPPLPNTPVYSSGNDDAARGTKP